MKAVKTAKGTDKGPVALRGQNGDAGQKAYKPMVSVVVPAYNEATILDKNLAALHDYLVSLEDEYRWEIILVNDGSTDLTGELAERFASTRKNVQILHHSTNFGMGQAFQFAFSRCRGDYVITLDIDLSYSLDHIRQLLDRIRETKAKIVVASPYMKGGRVSNVPGTRRVLSVWANRFLSLVSKGNVSTLTGMVRVYDRRFLQSLDLLSLGMEINPEIIYKASLLQARIEEVPAHLCWHPHKAGALERRSSMRVFRHTMSVLLSGFLFRPVIFFLLPGLALLLFSFYVNGWMFIHFLSEYRNYPEYAWFLDRASVAVAAAYRQFPHTFIVGLGSLMLAVQLISLAVMSMQSKRYFEEIFHLGTSIYKSTQETRRD